MKKDKNNKKKSSKAFKIAYISLFLAACTVPLALWIPFNNNAPIGNKEPAPLPKAIKENGKINTDYFNEFDDYHSDHLPFRPQLVTADNYLKSGLLGANAANVIQGKNGYIFSATTIPDYVGETFSKRKINNIATTIKLMQEKAQSGGNKFTFVPVPNKNLVESKYMPDRYTKGKENNLSLLTEEMKNMGVNFVDMKSVLSQTGEDMYLKRDTHWNNIGALYGFNAIMNSLGKENTQFTNLDYKFEKQWEGDLDKLLYPSYNAKSYQYYFDVDSSKVKFILPTLKKDSNETMKELMGDGEKYDKTIKTLNPTGKGKLLMVRDSFGRALLPFLLNTYQSADLSRAMPFNMSTLAENSDTDVVFEIVERNLGNIVKSAPVMTAISCEKPQSTLTEKSEKNVFSYEKTPSYVRIYGTLDKKYFDDNSKIFITLTKENSHGEEKTFQAFPVCEKDLLECDDSDYGYSLFLPVDEYKESYTVCATVTNSKGNTNTDNLGKIN